MRISSILLISLVFISSSYCEDYLTLSYFVSNDCAGSVAAYENLVINNCFTRTSTTTGTLSNIMYSVKNGVVSETLYSDHNCTVAVSSATNLTLDSCTTGFKRSLTIGSPSLIASDAINVAATDPVGNYCSPSATISVLIDTCFIFTTFDAPLKFVCNGDSVDVEAYTQAGCAGTPVVSTITNTSCNAYRIVDQGPCQADTTTTDTDTTDAVSTDAAVVTSGSSTGTSSTGGVVTSAAPSVSGPSGTSGTAVSSGTRGSTVSGTASGPSSGNQDSTTSTTGHSSASLNLVNGLFVALLSLVCLVSL